MLKLRIVFVCVLNVRTCVVKVISEKNMSYLFAAYKDILVIWQQKIAFTTSNFSNKIKVF
jgi:hypothetical protein